MQTAIFNTDSKPNLKLLIELAKKLGIKTKILTDDEYEEIGLANAIKKGATGEYVETKSFVKRLRK